MNNGLKLFITVFSICLLSSLYFLPDLLFTNNFSSDKIYHETLTLHQSTSVEDVFINSQSLTMSSTEDKVDTKLAGKHLKELINLLQNLELDANPKFTVITNSTPKVIDQIIYWQLNFYTAHASGAFLIENTTNKIVKLAYFTENAINNLNPENIIQNYFSYLGFVPKSISQDKSSDSFQIALPQSKTALCYINSYYVQLNVYKGTD